jgi:hypothetical protein
MSEFEIRREKTITENRAMLYSLFTDDEPTSLNAQMPAVEIQKSKRPAPNKPHTKVPPVIASVNSGDKSECADSNQNSQVEGTRKRSRVKVGVQTCTDSDDEPLSKMTFD